jgi:hypothetical protein
MRSVLFNFRAEVPPERQAAMLAQIGTWEGIHRTAPLTPHARRAEVRRMCYAYVEDGVDIEEMMRRLSALPEVEAVSMPAERRLI